MITTGIHHHQAYIISPSMFIRIRHWCLTLQLTMKLLLTIFVIFMASCHPFLINPNVPVRQIKNQALHMSASEIDSPVIMVNGMPGPMATAAAEACLRKGLKLSPVAITGPDIEPQIISVADTVTGTSSDVRLIPSTDQEEILAAVKATKGAVGDKNFLAIDFTHPSAVNGNARFYVANDIPFVMGTTGGDREQLIKDVEGRFCVIAPNMAKQIVALQAGLEDLAKKYPGAFAGYTLNVVESHQKTKADTSGTAKALVDSIKTLAELPNYSYDDINMIRNDEESVLFGVSKDAIKGHAFHTYTLTSPDNSVEFVLKHNVEGRTIYAEGTADAVKFLAEKIKTEPSPRVFNMIDVLQAGAM